MNRNTKAGIERQPFFIAVPEYEDISPPPFLVLEAGRVCAQTDYKANTDSKCGYLFVYTVLGEGELACKKRLYPLGKGNAVVVSFADFREYYSKSSGEDWVFYYIRFNGSGCAFYESILNMFDAEPILISDKMNLDAYIDKLFTALKDFDGYHRCLQAETVCQMLTLLAAEKQIQQPVLGQIENIYSVANFIDKNHWQPLCLDELAKTAGVSKYHFLRIFKQVLGVTPYKYMLMKRMEQAKRILKSTELTAHQVSMMIGFKDECHFSRAFKNITGMTPLEYRKRQSRKAT